MGNHEMIITPKELNDQKRDLLIVDIRPSDQRTEFPLVDLSSFICGNDELADIQEKHTPHLSIYTMPASIG